MKHLRKTAFIFISILIIISMSATLISAASADVPSEEDVEIFIDGDPVTSKAAIVIDFNSGIVIFEYNADELRVPASMAKMVAVFVVLDAIRDRYTFFDAFVQTSEAASIFSYNREYSNVPMPRYSFYTVRELLGVVIARSASAATVALGEGIFGSEEELVIRMNEKAMQLGIEAHFYDSWGGSPENRLSARGMADITRALIKEHPVVLDFTSQKSVFFDEIEYRNTNPLLNDYAGVDGFKTGFTNPAGWCFTGTAQVDGRRLITVTMGSVQGFRFPDSVILLDYGFANFDRVIANHFRNSSKQLELHHIIRSPLVPIKMYDIEESQYFDLLYIAMLLNKY